MNEAAFRGAATFSSRAGDLRKYDSVRRACLKKYAAIGYQELDADIIPAPLGLVNARFEMLNAGNTVDAKRPLRPRDVWAIRFFLDEHRRLRNQALFELMTEARTTLLIWLNRRGGSLDDFIISSRVNYMGHLSTRQYARLVDEWVGAVGLNTREYGTHSMRRTNASLIYKATGNLRAVQILLFTAGRTSSTCRVQVVI